MLVFHTHIGKWIEVKEKFEEKKRKFVSFKYDWLCKMKKFPFYWGVSFYDLQFLWEISKKKLLFLCFAVRKTLVLVFGRHLGYLKHTLPSKFNSKRIFKDLRRICSCMTSLCCPEMDFQAKTLFESIWNKKSKMAAIRKNDRLASHIKTTNCCKKYEKVVIVRALLSLRLFGDYSEVLRSLS